jgi:Zn finger protein HypA/HybF involved in hydrogenase expression
MGHGELICRNCFVETGLEDITHQSEKGERTQAEFVCPNCGSDSFGI